VVGGYRLVGEKSPELHRGAQSVIHHREFTLLLIV